MTVVRVVLEATALVTIVYFAALNCLYLVFTAIAFHSLTAYLRRRRFSTTDEAFASPLTPGISVILPAFNEAAGIVESVRSLLDLRYPRHEVIVVNDGSTDRTLSRLHEEFELVPVHRVIRRAIPTAPIRSTWLSRRHSNLCVIDKENGGKADALNSGICAAIHPYVCAIDADALIEPDALLRVAEPILADPEHVVATGGIVRIANGCTIDHGRVTAVGLPRSRLAVLQVVEYFRAFLVGRVAWTRLNALLIISGAFGLFRRSIVEEVGGYWTATVGEDVELVVRIHRLMRERGDSYRIAFMPEPVCWTEAPEDLRTLSRQRRRWHRGLGQTMRRHRRVLANPRYGTLGMLAFPYFVLFEFIGPAVALVGPPATIAAFAVGQISLPFVLAFIVVSLLLGAVLSIGALALEEFSFRRHPRGRDVARLTLYALLENFGYRQLGDFWRVMALFDLARGKQGWGAQTRRGIGMTATPPMASDGDIRTPAPPTGTGAGRSRRIRDPVKIS